MAIVLRQVKGSPLTIEELDGNFEEVVDRLEAVEELGSDAGRRIDFIEQPTDDTLLVHYVDETTDGPFTLPTRNWNFRGAWAAATSYAIDDVITAESAVYLVLFAHTSNAEFDPGDNDGMGHDYYGLLLEVLSAAVSPVIEVSDDTFEPSIAQANSYFRCTHVDGCLVTIPLDDDVAFPISTELHFRQCTDNPVVFDEGTFSPTLNGIDGFLNETARMGAQVTIKKIDTDEWDLIGYLAEGSA